MVSTKLSKRSKRSIQSKRSNKKKKNYKLKGGNITKNKRRKINKRKRRKSISRKKKGGSNGAFGPNNSFGSGSGTNNHIVILKDVTSMNDIPDDIKTSVKNGTKKIKIILKNTVTEIKPSGFSNLKGLVSIELPDNLQQVGRRSFNGCTSLTSIKLPANLQELGDSAFSGCTDLTSIELPANLQELGNYAFTGCTSLTSIKLPANLTTIGMRSFNNCEKLEHVYIKDHNTSTTNSTLKALNGNNNIFTNPNEINIHLVKPIILRDIGGNEYELKNFEFKLCTTDTCEVPDINALIAAQHQDNFKNPADFEVVTAEVNSNDASIKLSKNIHPIDGVAGMKRLMRGELDFNKLIIVYL